MTYLKNGQTAEILWGLYRLANVYQLQGKYTKAIEVLKEIEKKDTNETYAHYELGINFQMLGKSDIARSHFQEFMSEAEKWPEEYPDDPNSYINYGKVFTRLGDIDTGWEIGKKALELDSTKHFQYAQFLAVQGRNIEALDHLEKALKNGYRDLPWIKLNPDLQLLHEEKRFKDLITAYFDL